MVIVKLRDEINDFTDPSTRIEGRELRFPTATGWGIQKVGQSQILCITKSSDKTCGCDDDTPNLIASLPWHTVAMVHVPGAIQASV